MIPIILFTPLFLAILAYSYVWTDLAIVLMLGETRPFILQLNQYRDLLGPNRLLFAHVFLIFIFLLTLLQIFLLLSKSKLRRKHLVITLILLLIPALSYPFLSSDIFSYLFAGKIAYFYHLNPYAVIPETFRNTDLWVGFTYWTHRSYVYGPVYLLYSIIPLIISSGKQFVIAFYGMKLMNFVLFSLAGYQLFRWEKQKFKVLAYWFFNPLLIIELLINSHNEVVMISLFIIAYLLIRGRHEVWGWVIFLLSILTKYISAPLFPAFIISKRYISLFYITASLVVLFYLGITFPTVQAWYYTWIYMMLPFASLEIPTLLSIFIFQFFLIWVKYYPFIATGAWNQTALLPYVQGVSILLPFLIITLERQQIANSLKELFVKHSPIIEKSPN